MTKPNIFIDGSAGTTGLRIYERLCARDDINLILLGEETRKNPAARKDAINRSDISFLCLPDDAAIEAVSFVENPSTAIIDTSTAHRTNPDWCYGFAELQGGAQAQEIAKSKRIANPGCHASGFIALVEPLIQNGILNKDTALSCFSLTGYSGGGKKMIAEYEADERSFLLDAPRLYALNQQHKHLKEMSVLCGLQTAPAFCPIVGSFYSGMEVSIPLFAKDINATIDEIRELYKSYYTSPFVHYNEQTDESGFLSSGAYSGRDDMEISIYGNEERILLVSRFDNLGKGASGAAIQNMNILLGIDPATGLNLS